MYVVDLLYRTCVVPCLDFSLYNTSVDVFFNEDDLRCIYQCD